MSAGRVSKLVAPSAGRRNNNNGEVRPSPRQAARQNVVGNQSTTPRSLSVMSPRSGAGEDYVTIQFVNGHCTQKLASTTDEDGTGSGCRDTVVTSLEQHQQAIVASHLQVNTHVHTCTYIHTHCSTIDEKLDSLVEVLVGLTAP